MIKWTIKIFLILVAITVFTLFYLSFYGLETDYFNSTIQNKVKGINSNLDLEFQKTNILLDLKKLELKVKVTKPKINFNNTSTDLSKLNLNISVKSFLKNEFALQHGEVGLFKTDIKQLIELTNQIKPSPFLFFAKGIFIKGQIEGETKINFDATGKIKDDYKITGSIFNFNAKILKKFNVNQTNEPSISLKIGISTLSLRPHKIGINAIKVIIALITCKPNDSIILANLLQSSCIL